MLVEREVHDVPQSSMRVGKKRVARLMRPDGLRGVCRRKWVVTTTRVFGPGTA
jgi:hypothetical protein